MKRVIILSTCFIPQGEAAPLHLFEGSVLDLDDNDAGLLIAAARAKLAEEGAKLKDTSKDHLKALDTAAQAAEVAQAQPGQLMVQLMQQMSALASVVGAIVPAQAATPATAAASGEKGGGN
jgi:hypothetical protein